jgi:predicted ribosome quality control (RQC) complex YloA/Tae2 family protein
MMNLKEVRRAAGALADMVVGAALQRVVQLDDFRLAMEFYGRAANHRLLLSCQPRFARISSLEVMPQAPPKPLAFAQYLRAHLGRAVCASVETSDCDRRIRFNLTSSGSGFALVLSILGPRSNIYFLGSGDLLLYAMRPLAETRRELALGDPWVDPEGRSPSEGVDRWEGVPKGNYLQAISVTYAELEAEEKAQVWVRRLGQALNKELDALDRKAVNLLRDLGEAVRAEEYRRQGDLLKLSLHLIRPGDETVTVTDFETGSAVVIRLDPRLSPAENLTAYFKRYQKEVRGAAALQRQLQRVRQAQEELAAFQHRLHEMLPPSGSSLDKLKTLAAEPQVRRLLNRHAPERRTGPPRAPSLPPKVKEIPGRLQPKRYRTEEGLEIWVGRNEEGNDFLTTRLARGNDLFFHLEGYPGSHVVLRTGGRSDPPAASILDACELAVHFSRMKEARQADVHVAPIKNVRKPKGAKPGLVMVTRGKTIHLRRNPRRLESILATRLDE